MKLTTNILFLLSLLVLTGSCSKSEKISDINLNSMITKDKLTSLPGKRVYFGHQSVGSNIIDGIKNSIIENEELNFIKIVTFDEYLQMDSTENDNSFYLVHSNIGRNAFPMLKLSDFAEKIDSLKNIDAAFMKFCYVDITRETDIENLYGNYLETMSTLKIKYPKIRFLYFTAPITARENPVFALLKGILRRPDDMNKNRNRFNKLIRQTENINLFDLAFLESHDKTTTQLKDGKEFLLKKYSTEDGGHLNSIGSKVMGMLLLVKINETLSN